MRLAEEVLSQGDHQLKSLMDSNIETFIQVVRSKSQIKGCRWDDIVFRFEYETVMIPQLLREIAKSSISQVHKNYLESTVKKEEQLDLAGLQEFIIDLQLQERD